MRFTWPIHPAQVSRPELKKVWELKPRWPPRAPSEFKGDFRIELLNTVARLISLWQFPVQAGRAELKTSSQLSP